MSELYSHLHEELELRLAESERVGYGFVLPGATASRVPPNAPKLKSVDDVQIAAQVVESSGVVLVDVIGIEPATPCLQSTRVHFNSSIANW